VPVYEQIRSNLYKDSVTLMRLSEALAACPGVKRATLLMGSEANKGILGDGGLLGPMLAAARPDDLMVTIEAEGAEAFEAAARALDQLLSGTPSGFTGEASIAAPRSLAAARQRLAGANLALVSVPGPYAAAEALKALRAGLNVFLFSDNVPLAAERRLKTLATRKGLLVMGPDCGTGILDGVPLGFANGVRRGSIGVIGASGTGMQEITCQIHRLGGGISQAIGTGGRDLAAEVGGLTTRAALALLGKDPDTKVVVLVSKPSAPAVAADIAAAIGVLGKPVVVLFLGAAAGQGPESVTWVRDLEAAAQAAIALAKGAKPARPASDEGTRADLERQRHGRGQRYVRGLYTGGTYTLEAQLVWRQAGLEVHSNAPLEARLALADARASVGHAAVDLGDDVFTVGRPHPIIDPSLRIERLLQEARDPEVAVVVLDVVIGTAAHPDPAAALGPAIREAKAIAAGQGRHLTVIAWVCGTEADSQGLARQADQLGGAGALLASGSTAAARLAALCAAPAATVVP
jgi:FdrA protein